MKATLPKESTFNGQWKDGKEQVAAMAVIAIRNGEFSQPITARFWMSRRGDGASAVYCSVWTSNQAMSANGRGTATGYGYHKRSAALNSALWNAGITLSEPIDGRGETAMRDALTAVARALGYRKTVIVEL